MLLGFQRTRVAHIELAESDSPDGQSQNNPCKASRMNDINTFTKEIPNFAPKNKFERKLVLGVLYRDGIVPRNKSK